MLGLELVLVLRLVLVLGLVLVVGLVLVLGLVLLLLVRISVCGSIARARMCARVVCACSVG